MRTCTSCNQTFSLDNFHKRRGRKSGYVTKCKQCDSIYKKKYRDNNKDIVRSWNKRRVPGWDINRYDEYVKLQNNRCAICGTDDSGLKDWCADHCHTENKARGLLCVKCNAGLGYFRDNAEYLQSAIDYLNKWK